MNLNKGISTPIFILLIIAVSVVVGVLVWQFSRPTEQPTPDQPSDYTTQSACEEADYYWYDNSCHGGKQKDEDTSEDTEPGPSKSISLISPNGGEEWEAGEAYDIKWDSRGVDKVNIEYGNGKSWPIAYDVDAGKGEYSWEIPEDIVESYSGAVPEEISKFNAKVMIWDANERDVSDKSDDPFTIFKEEPITKQPSDYSAPATCEEAGYYWYDDSCHDESQLETADWKIYRNEEYGFEFKYPKDWYLLDGGNDEISGGTFDLYKILLDDQPIKFYEESKTVKDTLRVRFAVTEGLTLGTRDWENITIGELSGIMANNCNGQTEHYCAEIVINPKDKSIEFLITTSRNPLSDQTTNQILSTFKFIE